MTRPGLRPSKTISTYIIRNDLFCQTNAARQFIELQNYDFQLQPFLIAKHILDEIINLVAFNWNRAEWLWGRIRVIAVEFISSNFINAQYIV